MMEMIPGKCLVGGLYDNISDLILSCINHATCLWMTKNEWKGMNTLRRFICLSGIDVTLRMERSLWSHLIDKTNTMSSEPFSKSGYSA